jgi:Ca2+-binding RTX toxin-like protein
LLSGGPGFDTARYHDYTSPVTVTLNGVADDGAAGEAGNVITEKVEGGTANDELIGNAEENHLLGSDGDDVVEGRGGHDFLSGNAGDDTIWALDGAVDLIRCGLGYDTVLADHADQFDDDPTIPDDDCEAVSRP